MAETRGAERGASSNEVERHAAERLSMNGQAATKENEGERWSALRNRLRDAFPPQGSIDGEVRIRWNAELDAWASYIAQLETKAALTGTPQPSVGAAVEEWISHVLAALGGTEPLLYRNESTERGRQAWAAVDRAAAKAPSRSVETAATPPDRSDPAYRRAVVRRLDAATTPEHGGQQETLHADKSGIVQNVERAPEAPAVPPCAAPEPLPGWIVEDTNDNDAPETDARLDPGTPGEPQWTPWRSGATAPLDRLEEIRSWLDGAWPKDFAEGTLITWLMTDIGWCRRHLSALPSGQPEAPSALFFRDDHDALTVFSKDDDGSLSVFEPDYHMESDGAPFGWGVHHTGKDYRWTHASPAEVLAFFGYRSSSTASPAEPTK